MSVVKLAKNEDGAFLCPDCHEPMEVLEGGAVSVKDGRVDYTSTRKKKICRACGVYYVKFLDTDYDDVFTLTEEVLNALEEQNKAAKNKKGAVVTKPKNTDPVVALKPNDQNDYECPRCGKPMVYQDGGALRVVNGKVDYESVKPRFICYDCRIFYRELLSSGLYEAFTLEPEEKRPPAKRQIKSTGDLKPVELKRDADGHCACPRCGADMKFLEPEAVKIVNGRADMSDTVARFKCDECSSLYRRIAMTNYYQWCEK